ncbi:hypothetical protein CHUAL_000549 [Chamberlinius hualienensis]
MKAAFPLGYPYDFSKTLAAVSKQLKDVGVMASSEDSALILVTGANGYIASHVIQLLQKEGYKVRGSVRDLKEESKTQWLKQLCPDAKHELELVEADLLKEDGWAAAVKDCQFVIHTASPFPNQNVTNSEDELFKPAVEGTKLVLKACSESKTVQRVVLTSSITAVHGDINSEENKVYTEEDWTNPESPSLDNYAKSKTLAEKAAWDFVKELKDDEKFELVVINPGLVLGPVLGKNPGTSVEIIKRMIDRGMPAIPKANFTICDVRDVALAHYKALTLPEAVGHRHIIATQNLWMKEMAQTLAKEFRPQGYSVSTLNCPYFALWVKGFFDKSVKLMLPRLGKEVKFESKRMVEVLDITPTAANSTLLDTAYSLIEQGIVKKSKKFKGPKSGEGDAGTSETKKEEDEKKEEKKEEESSEKEKGEAESHNVEETKKKQSDIIEENTEKCQKELSEDKKAIARDDLEEKLEKVEGKTVEPTAVEAN